MNQQIVYINKSEDTIIVQDKEAVYQDTLENYVIDGGTAIPEYIQSMDYCLETKLRMLNGERIEVETEHGAEAIAYANALIETAQSLYDKQYARRNPPKTDPEEPELTPEEKQKQELEKKIWESKDYLNETDYAVIKCMELGLDLDTEYPGLKAKRQEARDAINAAEVQVLSLEKTIAANTAEEGANA